MARTGDEGKGAKRKRRRGKGEEEIRAARVMLEGWRGGRKAGGRLRLGQSTTATAMATASEWVAKEEYSVNRMRAISFSPIRTHFSRAGGKTI